MIKINRYILSILSFLTFAQVAVSQGVSYYEDDQFDPYRRHAYKVGQQHLHPAIREYNLNELAEYYDLDSLLYNGIRLPDKKMNFWRRFIYDDILLYRKNDIYLAINPLFDFSVGKDGDRTTYVNSRGFYTNGNLGKNFWFYLDFSENQGRYPSYYVDYIDGTHLVVPGQGNCHYEGIPVDPDFQVGNGYIGFNVGPYVDFQIGKTKTFIGDGYRSLFLSDCACSYPMIKFNVHFWTIRYMMMVAQIRTLDDQGVLNNGYRTKWTICHYLDWNVCKRFSFGLFEDVTQASWRLSGEHRSLDWEYLVPFSIFRCGEFNAGSPDKMLIGVSMRFTPTDWVTFHGQFVFNEFRAKELFGGDGYWSNKYGFLVGVNMYDIFRGFDLQLEYSQVRPFTYSQYDGMSCYTHMNESLAHPLGANFREFVAIANYRYKRLSVHGQFNYSQYGDDIPGDSLSYGHNPNIASTKRNASNGVYLLQGAKTNLVYGDIALSFLINPRSMWNITAGARWRKNSSDYVNENSKNYYISMSWRLKKHYFDF